MTDVESKMRRRRGASPRGEFEAAKTFATASEDARIAKTKRKSEALRAARLTRAQSEADQKQAQAEEHAL
ncbi:MULTISPECIES: hypothetical protein [unclassified Rhizobium]|uniref:hypothetical protein n=1 Tax=unclassified Rhizobium TaxID=2613769 RepID=UPI00071547A5|nr:MULTISPECIES: hypothetical protein [unclassified Rhizobium]KQS86640.1 hypothetical protein ASG50_28640 [Rhizobium sp. Leaf386]KQU05883.1 hypothetical protein ASG68_24235 [Rhizobium sp. Leaf453]